MSADQLDKDLKKKSEWACKWKMISNPVLSKQVPKDLFSRKTNKISHPTTIFNTVPVACTPCQKHLGLYIDEQIKFESSY